MRSLAIILIAVAALLMLMGCKSIDKVRNGKPAPTGQLVSFHYVEHGMMAQPNFEYTLKHDDKNKVTLCVYRPWTDEGWGETIKVSVDVVAHVEKLIKENNLQNYKDHYSPKMQVLDGYHWFYEAEFDDETSLSSGGSNARPGDNTLKVIAEYLDSCYASVKGIKLND